MVDLSFLEKFTKGDKKKMKRYIKIYLSIAPATFQDMEQHVKTQDWEELRIKAHSLKPQADYMGIPSLKAVLMEIEESVQNKQFGKLAGLFEEALSIHSQSVPQLKSLSSAL
jgi:HPt (histidine-containing phosphotransfer) domain-containing protein